MDFNAIEESGGFIHWNNTNTLMHDKFCIIDENIVITGSYNWTNKAEYNDESVMIIRNEVSVTSSYLNLFEKLINKYPISRFKCENTETHEVLEQNILETEPFNAMAKINGYFDILEYSKIIIACRYVNKEENKVQLSIFDYSTLKPILPFEYDEWCYNYEDCIWLRKNGRWALYCVTKKQFLTKHIYTSVRKWEEPIEHNANSDVFLKETVDIM